MKGSAVSDKADKAEAKAPSLEKQRPSEPAKAPEALAPQSDKQQDGQAREPKQDDAPKTPPVSLAVYLTQQKIAPDQAAGFAMHAQINDLQKKTILQWKSLHDTFNKRPV